MANIPSPQNPIPMPRPSPSGTTEIEIEGLGTAKGFVFPGGVREIWGVPYGRLNKRWGMATLATSWENNRHDGTKHGPIGPNPPGYDPGDEDVIPIGLFPHLPPAPVNELKSLNLNIALPPGDHTKPLPVMVFIHGGAFVFGASDHPGYDPTNFVEYSALRGTPVIFVSMNYRFGLGGFLASKEIKADLARDGHEGVGNFGLVDQQLALEWIQKYIPSLGGDKDNVTIFGESAGGTAVASQCLARAPPVFHRVILQSGHLWTIPPWPLERHEVRYQALLRYFKIDPDSPDALEQLRKVPDADLAGAIGPVEGGHEFTFQNPCLDGVFYADTDWAAQARFPAQVKSVMLGDTRDEGSLWRFQCMNDDYDYFLNSFCKYMSKEQAEKILSIYGLTKDTSREEVCRLFEDVCSDAGFRMENWWTAHHTNVEQTYAYHMDQESTLDHVFKGVAYHAIDLLYMFLTLTHMMPAEQLRLAYTMAGHWIDFAHGKEPWERFGKAQKWMVYGPTSEAELKSEVDDEKVRGYQRMKTIEEMRLLVEFQQAFEDAAMKTWKLGTTV